MISLPFFYVYLQGCKVWEKEKVNTAAQMPVYTCIFPF